MIIHYHYIKEKANIIIHAFFNDKTVKFFLKIAKLESEGELKLYKFILYIRKSPSSFWSFGFSVWDLREQCVSRNKGQSGK